MKIFKILNNNAIICKRNDEETVIAIGKGIGFQKKIGDIVKTIDIQKIFIQEEYNLDSLSNIFSNVSHQYIEAVQEIIDIAEKQLNKKFKGEVYYNLISHCQFAIERFINGVPIINNLFWEVKNFYTDEYSIGTKSVEILNKKFNVDLPEEEASFIAIHLIDADLEHDASKIIIMTELIEGISRIIKYSLNIVKNNQNEFDYSRLIMHLRQFISVKLYNLNNQDSEDSSNFKDSFETMSNKYPDIKICIDKIENFILNKYNHSLNIDAKFYILVHLVKIKDHSK